MRATHSPGRYILFLLVGVALAATRADAMSWRGVSPGETTATAVTAKFGPPERVVRSGSFESWGYFGKRPIAGQRQVIFRLNANRQVVRIDVFPQARIPLQVVFDTYGGPCSEHPELHDGGCYVRKLADAATYYLYASLGFAVFERTTAPEVSTFVYLPQSPPGSHSNERAQETAGQTDQGQVAANNHPPSSESGAGSGQEGTSAAGTAATTDSGFGGDSFSSGGDDAAFGNVENSVEMSSGPTVSGSLRAGYWQTSQDLYKERDLFTRQLYLSATNKLGSFASWSFEGYVLNQEWRAPRFTGRVRQGNVFLSAGPLDLRLGQQVISWGRADGINPTDNLAPRDYTLLAAEQSDQLLGNLSALARWNIGNFSLTGVWVPYFQPSVIPTGPLPAPLAIHDQKADWSLDQYAVRIDQVGSAIDWSASYFEGLDLLPTGLHFDMDRMDQIGLMLDHERIRVFGADAATVLFRSGVRAEIASSRPVKTSPDPIRRHPFLAYVIGADHTFFGNFNINLQYIGRYIQDYQDPSTLPAEIQPAAFAFFSELNQMDRIQHGATARLDLKLFHETLDIEGLGVVWLTRRNYLLRARVSYALSDHWRVLAGVNYFGGDPLGFFGRLNANSGAFGELRLVF